jgi:hypothetical protein
MQERNCSASNPHVLSIYRQEKQPKTHSYTKPNRAAKETGHQLHSLEISSIHPLKATIPIFSSLGSRSSKTS